MIFHFVYLILCFLAAAFIVWLGFIIICGFLGAIFGIGSVFAQSHQSGSAKGPIVSHDDRWNYKPEEHGMTRD